MTKTPNPTDSSTAAGHLRTGLQLRSQAHRFIESAVLFALVDLEVFSALEQGPLDTSQLGRRLKLDSELLGRVLRAGLGLKLLQKDAEGRLHVPASLQPFLASDQATTVIPWIRFIHSIAPNLYSLADVVKGHLPVPDEDDYCLRGANLEAFGQAMDLYARTLGVELPRFVDLSQARSLLDLASGPGTYAFLLGRQYPALSLGLVDEARVLELARETAAEFGLEDRVQYLPGDVLRDPIPTGYDAMLISNLLHLIGPDASQQLLRRCFGALEPGGTLIVQAQFLPEGEMQTGWPVVLDLILLTSSGSGRNHSATETMRWMQQAGFVDLRFEPMSVVNVHGLVLGRKPAARPGS